MTSSDSQHPSYATMSQAWLFVDQLTTRMILYMTGDLHRYSMIARSRVRLGRALTSSGPSAESLPPYTISTGIARPARSRRLASKYRALGNLLCIQIHALSGVWSHRNLSTRSPTSAAFPARTLRKTVFCRPSFGLE